MNIQDIHSSTHTRHYNKSHWLYFTDLYSCLYLYFSVLGFQCFVYYIKSPSPPQDVIQSELLEPRFCWFFGNTSLASKINLHNTQEITRRYEGCVCIYIYIYIYIYMYIYTCMSVLVWFCQLLQKNTKRKKEMISCMVICFRMFV
jgi:hypothetical protein